MPNVNGMSCCGIGEITGLSNTKAKDFIANIQCLVNSNTFFQTNNGRSIRKGALVFTSNSSKNSHYGSQFATQITKYKLGKVVKVPHYTNPNTGHTISAYVWVIDKKAFLAFTKKHKIWKQANRYGY